MQLRAADGRVQLGGTDAAELPGELGRELQEWAIVVQAVAERGDDSDREMLRRRGRLLATRLARAKGEPVDYVDPVTGDVEPIRVPRPRSSPGHTVGGQGRRPPTAAPAVPAGPVAPAVPAGPVAPVAPAGPPVYRSVAAQGPANPTVRQGMARPGAHAEPTPWATGLTVTACIALVVTVADVTLSRAFATEFGWLWLPLNLVVGAGIAPSLWLVRGTAFWRWIGYGVAAGLVVAWIATIVTMLG